MDELPFAVAVTGLIVVVLVGVWLRPRWIVDAPRSTLAVVVALTVASLVQIVDVETGRVRLRVDPSTEPLLPAKDAEQAFYDDAVRDFGDDEVYVIALECDEVFTVDCLKAMERVSGPIARLEGVRSLGSLLDVTSFRYVPADDWIEVTPFIEDIPDAPGELAELRRRALRDPVYRRTLVSEDGKAAAINVNFRKMTNVELIDRDLDGKIRRVLEPEEREGRRIHVSGRPHFKTHVYHGMLADLLFLIPLGLAVMAVVLWIFTGTLRGIVLPIAASASAVFWTFAAMVWTDHALNLLTVLLAPMLLAIGSVYVVHFLARFHETVPHYDSVREAVLACLEHMLTPVLISGATTILGFAALLITDVPAVYELGLLSMLGIASMTVLCLTAIPAALVLLPTPTEVPGGAERLRRRVGRRVGEVLDRWLAGLSLGVRRWRFVVMAGSGAVGVLALALLPRIVIDTDYLSYFEKTDPVRMEFEAVNRLLAGAVPLYVVVGDGDAPNAFRDPEVVRALEELQRRLDAVPGVSRTLSFIDSMRMLNRAFEGDDPAAERVPDTRGGVTELLFMLPKNEMSRYVTVNHSRANIIVRTGQVGSAAVLGLRDRIQAVLDETPLPAGLRARVTGNAILLAKSADGIAYGQPLSVAVAALSIFLFSAVGLRSPKLGAVAMLPNLLPVLFFFGLLGAGVAPLSLPTSLIGCIALGIAVDDTVHFLVRYREERRAGSSPEEAAERCGRHVGRPIAITSVMLCAGFGVVTFSEFATLQEFGMLTSATMLLCLVADLMLLPALLLRFRV